jgi:putative solute:sodium symporter small subunit
MVLAWAGTGGEECAGDIPRVAAESGPTGLFGREEIPMDQLLQGDLAQIVLNAQQSPYWARAKRLLAVMLGLWMAYFLLVNWFVHSLNKIAVPVLSIPLGTYLAVQGAAIVFAVALFRFARPAD